MISKKSLPAALLILLVIAALAVGVGQAMQPQVIPAVGSSGSSGAQSTSSDVRAVPDAPALPPAAGIVTFSDGFSSAKLDAWHNLPEASGTWLVKSGRLRAWGNEAGDLVSDQIALVTNDASFGDGILEAYVYPTSGEPVGMLFRGSDAGYYRLSLYANLPNKSPKAVLDRLDAGGTRGKEIATNTTWAGFAYSTWQRMEVRATGDHIIVSLDGTQIFDVTDSPLKSGWVGLWTAADRGAEFDNVRVQRDVAGR